MKNYIVQKNPFIVPLDDNKVIKEHFGKASIESGEYSIAHMVAPAGWGEPYQNPEFDEITIVVRGKKQIEADGDIIVISAGESVLIKKGARVRYSNPFNEDCEYLSFCLPAFTPGRANRE